MSLFKQSIKQLNEQLTSKQLSAVELTKEYLNRAKQLEPQVDAFTNFCDDVALAQAQKVDDKIKNGESISLLSGIPGGIKDIINIKGVKTTCSSKILENFVAPYDATVISKLKQHDAVFLGKTNMDEFAMGSTTQTSYFKKTKNPWALNCVPGGSSGGSVASVAGRQVVWSLGTDTGGSIRQPAAFTGTTGIKPTYGRVSRFGCVAFSSSLDQIGPIASSVEDCAIVLNAICGHCENDSTSSKMAVPDFTSGLNGDVRGMKIGVPKEYFSKGLDSKVAEQVKKAIEHYQSLGAEIVDISLPHTEYAVATYYIIAPAEASSNLARFDGVKYGYRQDGKDLVDMMVKTRSNGFGEEVKRRIMLGTYVLSAGFYDAYYNKAMKVRTLIVQDFKNAFDKVDVIISPTTPTTAFPIGNSLSPIELYMLDAYTIPVNMAGLPGMSVPCGFVDNKPVGLQIIGKPFDEQTVLKAGYAFEQTTDYHKQFAPVGGK